MTQGSRLKDKAALITGGAGGIGAATARAFCGEGASVLLVDTNEQALAKTVADLRQLHPHSRIESRVADISREESGRHAVEQAASAFGRLDVLVNNASMRNYSALSEATPAEWQAMVAVNLIGLSNFCKAALPLLRQAGKPSIVNVSSCYAVTGRKGMGLYDATKAGILSLTRTLAFEEAGHGIRVNAVCPGSTLTDFHVNRTVAAGKSVEELKTQRQTTSLLGRWAAPEEIAWPILWLASDEASFITGTTLLVDGGLHIM